MADAVPTREIFWNVGATSRAIFYVLAALAVGALLYGFYRRWLLWRRGRPGDEPEHLWERVRFAAREVFGHRSLLRKPLPGTFHLLLFWSFAALFVGTVIIAVEYDTPLDFFHGRFFLLYELTLDAAGVLLLAGLGLAAIRRYLLPSAYLEKRGIDSRWTGFYLLAMLGILVLTGFLVEGARISATDPPWRAWCPVGSAVGWLLGSVGIRDERARSLHLASWWVHAGLVFGFVATMPSTGFRHVVIAPLQLFFRSRRPKGAWNTPFVLADLDTLPPDAPFAVGAASTRDFSWKQRLSFDACTRCARCDDQCPAVATGTALSPKSLILKLRAHMSDPRSDDRPLLDAAVSKEEVWSCTTCGACMEHCPVSIEHIDVIGEIRRRLVDTSRLTEPMRKTLANVAREHNPWGLPHAERATWIGRLPPTQSVKQVNDVPDPEVLYWVGCAAAYDERANAVARSFLRLLEAAGVRYAVLGGEERCTGDVARRFGEEGLFQQLARYNIETLRRHRVRRIVATCPHCFNTLKNEYPQLGGDFFEVTDHNSFLAELIGSGRLQVPSGSIAPVTYHDPCYLGRHNDVYVPPRSVLESIGETKVLEMERNRDRAFCCGAGGGNYWFEVPREERCEGVRLEEARRTGARVLGVSCPFCLAMFNEAQKRGGERTEDLAVLDVAEILAEHVGKPPARA